MVILGIDPGATGAVAVLVDGKLTAIHDMPTVRDSRNKVRVDPAALGALVHGAGADVAVIELVAARPGQGVSSMFNFGVAAGIVQGVCGALALPMEMVAPQVWKGALHVGRDDARQRASRLLPTGASYWPLVKHDGRAEAALIALWYVMKVERRTIW